MFWGPIHAFGNSGEARNKTNDIGNRSKTHYKNILPQSTAKNVVLLEMHKYILTQTVSIIHGYL